jgi:hypothetical protein
VDGVDSAEKRNFVQSLGFIHLPFSTSTNRSPLAWAQSGPFGSLAFCSPCHFQHLYLSILSAFLESSFIPLYFFSPGSLSLADSSSGFSASDSFAPSGCLSIQSDVVGCEGYGRTMYGSSYMAERGRSSLFVWTS